MKKLLFTLTLVATAFCALTFTACEKKETAGQKLDKAIDSTESGVHKFTKKAEEAGKETSDAVNKAFEDLQK
jgi:hypothetical protein